MAVFRIEKTRDFTVMSNHHLKNRNLTLKAKGLLSMILSLPDDWHYTTRGLASICKEGVDSISGAIKELEQAGYGCCRSWPQLHPSPAGGHEGALPGMVESSARLPCHRNEMGNQG